MTKPKVNSARSHGATENCRDAVHPKSCDVMQIQSHRDAWPSLRKSIPGMQHMQGRRALLRGDSLHQTLRCRPSDLQSPFDLPLTYLIRSTSSCGSLDGMFRISCVVHLKILARFPGTPI